MKEKIRLLLSRGVTTSRGTFLVAVFLLLSLCQSVSANECPELLFLINSKRESTLIQKFSDQVRNLWTQLSSHKEVYSLNGQSVDMVKKQYQGEIILHDRIVSRPLTFEEKTAAIETLVERSSLFESRLPPLFSQEVSQKHLKKTEALYGLIKKIDFTSPFSEQQIKELSSNLYYIIYGNEYPLSLRANLKNIPSALNKQKEQVAIQRIERVVFSDNFSRLLAPSLRKNNFRESISAIKHNQISRIALGAASNAFSLYYFNFLSYLPKIEFYQINAKHLDLIHRIGKEKAFKQIMNELSIQQNIELYSAYLSKIYYPALMTYGLLSFLVFNDPDVVLDGIRFSFPERKITDDELGKKYEASDSEIISKKKEKQIETFVFASESRLNSEDELTKEYLLQLMSALDLSREDLDASLDSASYSFIFELLNQ